MPVFWFVVEIPVGHHIEISKYWCIIPGFKGNLQLYVHPSDFVHFFFCLKLQGTIIHFYAVIQNNCWIPLFSVIWVVILKSCLRTLQLFNVSVPLLLSGKDWLIMPWDKWDVFLCFLMGWYIIPVVHLYFNRPTDWNLLIISFLYFPPIVQVLCALLGCVPFCIYLYCHIENLCSAQAKSSL